MNYHPTDPKNVYLNRILRELDPADFAKLQAEAAQSLRARADEAQAAGKYGEAEIIRGAADKLEGGA